MRREVSASLLKAVKSEFFAVIQKNRSPKNGLLYFIYNERLTYKLQFPQTAQNAWLPLLRDDYRGARTWKLSVRYGATFVFRVHRNTVYYACPVHSRVNRYAQILRCFPERGSSAIQSESHASGDHRANASASYSSGPKKDAIH